MYLFLLFVLFFIFSRREVYTEDGSSLCLGCELCWGFELQIFPSFLGNNFIS